MARRRAAHGPGHATRGNGAIPEHPEGVGDGAHETAADAEPQQGAPSTATERAEELVDRLAERVGHYTGQVGHGLLWLVTRAREEAEDIWAEAQALRRQNHPDAADTSDEASP
jgi:hypothetical protein